MLPRSVKVAICCPAEKEGLLSTDNDLIKLVYVRQPGQFLPGSDLYIDTEFSLSAERISLLEQLSPALIAVNEVTGTCSQLPATFIRYNGWSGFSRKPVIEMATASGQVPELAQYIANQFGTTCVAVPDQPGLVRPRIISMIINEAYHALGDAVGSIADIDIAMKTGTNYPYGPFEWARKIGLDKILGLLETLSVTDSKYRPAPELRAALKRV